MRRAANLTALIADTDNLLLAFHKAFKGHRLSGEALRFQSRLEENIAALSGQLATGKVEVGHYEYFHIEDPKLRLICAAAFRERVMHHAIMNVCHPWFERNLIDTTYATRPGKGLYKALERAQHAMRSCCWVAKCDFRKYFDSIPHDRLNASLARLFKDRTLLRIFSSIIASYRQAEGKGIPIGNLTSQYFANLYLSPMDHWVKEVLGVPEYIRYMDDFLVFARTRQELDTHVARISEYADSRLRLTLKPVVVSRVDEGVDFLGYRLFPHKIRLTQRSKRRFVRKSREYGRRLREGEWNEHEYYEHMTPLLAYASKGYTKGLRRTVFDGMDEKLFPRAARRELEQQRAELPRCEPEQQQPRQPQQQQRLPRGVPLA